MPIRIVLVDDHTLVREGVAALLELQPDLRVIASFGEGREAIRFLEREEPDVAILDVAMPEMNGIEVARQMRDASPATQILMLSMHANLEYVRRALLAGAQGYVVKSSAGRELIEAVRAVYSGRRYFSEQVERAALEQDLLGSGAGDPLGLLSTREREVLQLTVEGHSIADSAQRLGLSPKSVETYRSRLMAKLGIEDLPSLVKFAIRHGVTSTE